MTPEEEHRIRQEQAIVAEDLARLLTSHSESGITASALILGVETVRISLERVAHNIGITAETIWTLRNAVVDTKHALTVSERIAAQVGAMRITGGRDGQT